MRIVDLDVLPEGVFSLTDWRGKTTLYPSAHKARAACSATQARRRAVIVESAAFVKALASEKAEMQRAWLCADGLHFPNDSGELCTECGADLTK